MRPIRICFIASAFMWFWGGATLLAWTVLPLISLFVRDPVKRIRTCQRVLSPAFRLFHWYMRLLGLFDARVFDEIPRVNGGPVVLVANHTTLVDVTAILSRHPHTCCLARPSLVENFFVGPAARMCGFISAGTDVTSHAAALDKAAQRLTQGFDVLVFPEGTRSPPGQLLPFHRGGFEVACRAKVPLVALVLRCAPLALTKGLPFWKNPDTMAILTVAAESPTDPAETSYRSGDLRKVVETRYRRALCLLPETSEGAGERYGRS
jgi:1-acyl-sn-glycerol-3-phosphate acyltransferase